MFYLTMHSTHFVYGYTAKDLSDSERGNSLPPLRVLGQVRSGQVIEFNVHIQSKLL